MCLGKNPKEKMQRIKGLPHTWRFYFTNRIATRQSSSELLALHPDSLLHVVVGDNTYDCLQEALEECGYPAKKVNEVVKGFYEEQLGIPLRRQCKHDLVGNGYYEEWMDARGQRREIFGKITDCWENLLEKDDKTLHFRIQYNEEMRSSVQETSETVLTVSQSREYPEERAWGGFLAYKSKTLGGDAAAMIEPENPPFHCRWIVGTRFKEARSAQTAGANSLPPLVLFVGGYKLRFEAKKSRIKNAGLGLFVHISKLSGESPPGSFFEIPAGQLIDLGPYAPLLKEECKLQEVIVMKNFLDRYIAEGWSFDKDEDSNNEFDLFDITRHDALNPAATENIIVYANEPVGEEVPSIVCKFDAEGAIHYLLGHDEQHPTPLRIPLNKDVETTASIALPLTSVCGQMLL